MNDFKRPPIPKSKANVQTLQHELDERTRKSNPEYPVYSIPNSGLLLTSKEGEIVSIGGRVVGIMGSVLEISVLPYHLRVTYEDSHIQVGDLVHVCGRIIHSSGNDLVIEPTSVTRTAPCRKPWPPSLNDHFRLTSCRASSLEETRKKLTMRSWGSQAARQFFHSNGFVEIETPILRKWEDSNFNRTFRTRFQGSMRDHILRTSPEDYLRRAVMAFPAVFEIGKSFRNDTLTNEHLPEFTHIEFYQAYADLDGSIGFLSKLIREIALRVGVKGTITFRDREIDLLGTWQTISLDEAFQKYCGVPLTEWTLTEELRCGPRIERVKYFEALLKEKVVPNLIQPTFIRDFPVDATLLPDKVAPEEEGVKLKAELYIGGIEIGEVGTLNNDPDYLYLHNLWCIASRMSNPCEVAEWLDWDWLEEFEYGVPPAAGGGIGLDRLLMILAEAKDIREVVWYPFTP